MRAAYTKRGAAARKRAIDNVIIKFKFKKGHCKSPLPDVAWSTARSEALWAFCRRQRETKSPASRISLTGVNALHFMRLFRFPMAFTKSIAYKLSRDFSFSSFPGA